MKHSVQQNNLHVVLNEPLDLGIGECPLTEFDTAVLKLIGQNRCTEENNTPAKTSQ